MIRNRRASPAISVPFSWSSATDAVGFFEWAPGASSRAHVAHLLRDRAPRWRLLAHRRMARDPARERLPLLPVLLAARARQVEDRQPIARAIDVHLRVADVGHQREVGLLQEVVELTRGTGALVDTHRHE